MDILQCQPSQGSVRIGEKMSGTVAAYKHHVDPRRKIFPDTVRRQKDPAVSAVIQDKLPRFPGTDHCLQKHFHSQPRQYRGLVERVPAHRQPDILRRGGTGTENLLICRIRQHVQDRSSDDHNFRLFFSFTYVFHSLSPLCSISG